MDYSYYSGPQSQSYSLYGLHGLPTPEQTSNSSHTDTDIQETLASLVRSPWLHLDLPSALVLSRSD